jgi:hypothetical protein
MVFFNTHWNYLLNIGRCIVVFAGYNGALCEEDINECNDTSICGTGQCFNNPGSFTCVCQDGYFGPKCQVSYFCHTV